MHFIHPLVRELAWCISSSPLLVEHASGKNYRTLSERWFREEFERCLPWLNALDENPKQLIDFFEEHPTRLLGKRFELFVHFWLSASENHSLRAYSKQLTVDGKTSAEIDFIYEDLEVGGLMHLEVACKFYLAHNHSKAWSDWRGPNASDTLGLKMDKLQTQLSALKQTEGKAWIQSEGWPAPSPALMLKGYFFHHFSTLFSPKHPTNSSPGYPSGFWLWLHESGAFFHKGSHWVLLPKNAWLAPYRGTDKTVVLDHVRIRKEVAAAIHTYHRGVMLVSVDEVDGAWVERIRGMVVPNVWPGR